MSISNTLVQIINKFYLDLESAWLKQHNYPLFGDLLINSCIRIGQIIPTNPQNPVTITIGNVFLSTILKKSTAFLAGNNNHVIDMCYGLVTTNQCRVYGKMYKKVPVTTPDQTYIKIFIGQDMKYFPNSLFLVIVHILHKKSHDIIMAD